MSQPAFDFDDVELDDATNPTYTVGELAEAINDRLRRGFDDGIWVRGEIDDLTNRGPHTYFALVERGDEGKAVLNVQLFAPMKRNLTPILRRHRLELGNGMKVRIFGHLDFWAQAGRLGLKMAGLDPRYTLGEIAQSRDAILRRLVADGLLDANGRRPLSPAPLRVGVAASLESAAWHDFRDELERSGLGFRLVVADTRVQGETAAPMVAGAIGTLARRADLDVIVVIRGGGARNELSVFDAEPIARAIASSPVPVFTGLGHEIDRSVADEVAHTALKTPTACAAALVERVQLALTRAEADYVAIVRCATDALRSTRQRLHDTTHRIARHTHVAVERADERLLRRDERLAATWPAALARCGAHLDDASVRLTRVGAELLARQRSRLDVLEARTAALDPAVQLRRGWSITRSDDGAIVRSVDEVSPGERVVTTLIDGTTSSTVDAVHHFDPTESERPDG